PRSYRQVPLPKEYDPLHRRMRVRNVSPGTVVAVAEPELPGTPGQDVFGNTLLPQEADVPQPLLGPGVRDVGGRLVATREGRLVFTPCEIDVRPELVIDHDVRPQDGLIQFHGDVVIHGSVMDGSVVRALGSVTVHGSVYGSTVASEQNIVIRGTAVHARIEAGQSGVVYRQLADVLRPALEDLRKFHGEYRELSRHLLGLEGGERKLPMLAALLLDKRHSGLQAFLSSLCCDYQPALSDDARYQEIRRLLLTSWHGLGRTRLLEPDILHLIQLLEQYLVYLENVSSLGAAEVRVGGVSRSTVRASGSVYVRQSGVYSSSIESGDAIVVAGMVRGGFLVAERSARISELGSPAGVETSVRVTRRSGYIAVGLRYANTLLEVGGRRHRNLSTERNVRMKGDSYVDSNAVGGRLTRDA
ncbi:MAG: FapA family protein, partial [Alicyclobacillus sp.]|nr:FapA family protein [Alicyclobacillus sp.]